MAPCIRSHCPSSKHCCQRYTCTLELHNRFERRRSERDQLKAKLEADTASSMRALRKLKEDCDKIDKNSLSRAKQTYEDQTSEKVSRPKCFCAECAVEHKHREISSLRKNYQTLQKVQQVVADVQRRRESREKGEARAPPPHAGVPPAWNKHACPAAFVQSNGVEMIGKGIMECLPVKDLLDKGLVVERVFIPARVCR